MKYCEIFYDVGIADDTPEPILQELEKAFIRLDDEVETFIRTRVVEISEKYGVFLKVDRVRILGYTGRGG